MFALTTMLAAAIAVNARQIQSGELLGKTVSVRGSVIAAIKDELDSNYNWIIVDTPDGKVYGATDDDSWPMETLERLTDAEVEFTGIVGIFTSWRRFLGYQLTFGRERDTGLSVLTPAPDDPFSVPDLTPFTSIHRRKIHGQVIAATRGCFFLPVLSEDGRRMIIRIRPADGYAIPKVGTPVVVSGFPRWGQHYFQLNNACWRQECRPETKPDDPETIDAKSIFIRDNGRVFANDHLSGRVVRLSGTVEASAKHNAVSPEIFFLNCGGYSIKVDFSGIAGYESPEIGSTAEVAGLCYADFSEIDDGAMFPKLEGFMLIPRTAEDIRILRKPSWPTVGNLLAVIGVLLGVIGLFIGWVTALRIAAARRARMLVREQIRGARAELKVEERTRLAVELHDSISQTLTGVALQIDAASGTDGDCAKAFLSNARNMLASCRQELNGCLWDLRSRTFEEKDMTEAVQRTLAPHVGNAKLTVRFNVPRERLSEATAHAVLRIIRELGTNAVKHGHAKNVKIAGEFHDGTISFSVLDDGNGFDTETAPGPAQGHFGLQGVRERLNEFNGTIRCDSEPGCGAKFTVTLRADDTQEDE